MADGGLEVEVAFAGYGVPVGGEVAGFAAEGAFDEADAGTDFQVLVVAAVLGGAVAGIPVVVFEVAHVFRYRVQLPQVCQVWGSWKARPMVQVRQRISWRG